MRGVLNWGYSIVTTYDHVQRCYHSYFLLVLFMTAQPTRRLRGTGKSSWTFKHELKMTLTQIAPHNDRKQVNFRREDFSLFREYVVLRTETMHHLAKGMAFEIPHPCLKKCCPLFFHGRKRHPPYRICIHDIRIWIVSILDTPFCFTYSMTITYVVHSRIVQNLLDV